MLQSPTILENQVNLGMSIGSIVVRLNRLNQQLKTISTLRKMNDTSQVPSDSALEYIPERDIAGDDCKGQQCRKSCNIYQYNEAMEKRTVCKKGWSCCGVVKSAKPCCSCGNSEENQRLRHSQKLCHPKRTCLCKDVKRKESPQKKLQQSMRARPPLHSRRLYQNSGVSKTFFTKYSAAADESGNHKGPEKQSRGSSADRVVVRSMESITDNLDIDKLQQDLHNEKKLRAELAEQLENLTCSMKCLKTDGDQQAACLKDALVKAEEQAKLAVRSRNLAMDLAKQSRDHSDLIKASKSDLAAQIAVLKQENTKLAGEAEKSTALSKQLGQTICDNTRLACECKDLKLELKSVSENEAKKCAEVSEEVDKIKNAVHRKEQALNAEKVEFEEMVTELTNVVKIQKKQICELTGICNQQQILMQQKDMCISEKEAQLCERQCKLKTMVSKVKDLKAQVENSKRCLAQETETCDMLRKELNSSKDNQCCELRIKEKMIEDQCDTIGRLKKLVQESEKMAKHAAREFEQLTDQLFCEKERNCSLQAALEAAESQLPDEISLMCKSCEEFETQVDCLEDQRRKALSAAKFVAEKFFESKKEFQRQMQHEKQQQQLLRILLQKRENEIECLRAKFQHARQIAAEKRNICTN